ncbi:MAG: 5-(carboxyamino)imidazole ribonucleotide synthase [Verrucomicrobiales bacterium]|nr:5-(carboxyamino)imidazole ribonucleotide synthase [Verrucomicrobiales bacterium]
MTRLPNQTCIGVLGGGQLGRMLAIEARRMGYQIIQWVGGPDSGPARLSDEVIEEPFDCEQTLNKFLDRVDVVTVEFENIPSSLLRAVEARKPLYPSAAAIETSQHREREKRFLEKNRIPCAPFAVVTSAEELQQANQALPGEERILKTAEFGYDGKGQLAINRQSDPQEIWAAFNSPRAVLEQKIDLAGEVSVLVARNESGETVVYDPAENIHTNHILDFSIVPARFPEEVLNRAKSIAVDLSSKLDYIGILAVEFFLARDGSIIVNEIAPRPHNSGHHTIDGCYTSQFEQQLRAICDLPLGRADLKSPTVMWNILGDIWPETGEPDWRSVLKQPGSKLHLYGKREPRKGRKMGHINFTGDDIETLIARAKSIADLLGSAER